MGNIRMRLEIIIDNVWHAIDTTDPDLMFRWVREIFGRIPEWNRSTEVRLQAFASYLYHDGKLTADWIIDSRIIGQIQEVRSPGEWIAALTELAEKEKELR